jgi:hypothetical protein
MPFLGNEDDGLFSPQKRRHPRPRDIANTFDCPLHSRGE